MTPYYDRDGITIFHADCADVLPSIEGVVMVTDPPYGMGKGSRQGGADGNAAAILGEPTMRRGSDRVIGPEHVAVRDAALRLWGDRPAMVFGHWRAPSPAGTRWRLVWDKGAIGVGGYGPWRPSTEDLYVLGGGWVGSPRFPSIVRYPQQRSNLHPTPKPVGLFHMLLEWCPAGVIVDPFMGSGPIAQACHDLGRRYIGVEVVEEYCEVAVRRLAQGVLDFGGVAS